MKTVFLLLGITFSINGFPQISDKLLSNFLNLTKPDASPRIHYDNSLSKSSVVPYLKDSTYTWDWNSSSGNWDYPGRIKYSYNSFYKNSEILYEHSSADNVWYKSSRYTDYVYDSKHNMLSNVNQNWINSAWNNITKINYTCDDNNNVLSYTSQYWSDASSSWLNNQRLIYTYNSSNKVLTTTLQIWNVDKAIWENNYLGTATYNSNNEFTNYLEQTWNSSINAWENSGQAIDYIYENGDLTTLTWQGWNSSTFTFETTTKYIATYDGYHHVLSELWQSRNKATNTWRNDYITYFNYNANGNLIIKGAQTWNATSSKWENYYEENYSYDLNNNQISKLLKYWQSNSNSYVNSSREENYYPTTPTSIEETYKRSDAILIYPNPIINSFNITFSNSERQNVKLELINELGAIVQTEMLGNEQYLNKKISVTDLNSGIYFIKIILGNKVHYNKVILE